MKQYWIFTFGQGEEYGANRGKAVKIAGTYKEAREIMFEKYGNKWCGQYSEKEWNEWAEKKPWYVPLEEIVRVIENE